MIERLLEALEDAHHALLNPDAGRPHEASLCFAEAFGAMGALLSTLDLVQPRELATLLQRMCDACGGHLRERSPSSVETAIAHVRPIRALFTDSTTAVTRRPPAARRRRRRGPNPLP